MKLAVRPAGRVHALAITDATSNDAVGQVRLWPKNARNGLPDGGGLDR